MHDLVPFVVTLLAVAVLLGLRDTPCHDPQCAAFHRRHTADEAKVRRDNLEREAHRDHSRDYPQAGCAYCQGGGFGS